MTPNKEKLLAALLTSRTKKEAAAAAGISDRTMRSYFEDKEFCQRYREAFAGVIEDATRQAQALLMPVDALFAEYPPLIVELGQAEKLRNGAQVKDWHFAPGMYRVYSITGEFLLLGKVENTVLTTVKSFFEVTKA